MTEAWKVIEDSDLNGYEVSNMGRIRNSLGRICEYNNNYVLVYDRQGVARHLSVSKLVAEYFIPNPHRKLYIEHIDSDIDNNCVDNLRWVNGYQHKHTKKLDKLFYQALHSVEKEFGSVTNVPSNDARWQLIKTYR